MNLLKLYSIFLTVILISGCIQNSFLSPTSLQNRMKLDLLSNGISQHWNQIGDVNWNFQDEVAYSASGTGHLVSKESYDNFILEADFWINDTGNSGIFIRCNNPLEITASTCYEINIFDQRPDQRYRTGGIVNFAEPKIYINAGGNWNRFKIIADGPSLTVFLNDQLIIDIEDSTFLDGPLTLQNNGSANIKFKNVFLEDL